MRITSTMMMETTLRNIETNQQRTEDLQSQITSGSRITKPSEDPIGAAQAVQLQHTLDANKQYATNLDQATSWLDLTDSALGAVTQALQRTNELAVQAANADAQATFDPAFDAYTTLLNGLQSGNQAQIQSSLSKIGQAIDAVNLSR